MSNINDRLARLEALLSKGIISEITFGDGTTKRLDALETLDILLGGLGVMPDEPQPQITAVKWLGGKSYGRVPDFLHTLIIDAGMLDGE